MGLLIATQKSCRGLGSEAETRKAANANMARIAIGK